MEKILAASILIHGEKVLSGDTSIDTTVQPKNITYPTDTKLAVKMIAKSRRIADAENVDLRQGYKFVVRNLLRTANSRSPKQAKKRAAAGAKDKDDRGPDCKGSGAEIERGKPQETRGNASSIRESISPETRRQRQDLQPSRFGSSLRRQRKGPQKV